MQTRKLLNWWQTLTPIARFLAIALLAPLLVLNGWAIATIFDYFHSLIVILVGASVLAFLLNYPVSWMENHGAKREQVAILVFLLALSILLALGITLFPLALTQAQQLVARLPELIDSGRSQLMILNDKAESAGLPINLDALATQINDRVKGQLQSIAGQVLNLAVVTVTSLLDFLLTMVLTFYLLQHGGELWESLVQWLPSKFRDPFSNTVRLSFQKFFYYPINLIHLYGFCSHSRLFVVESPFWVIIWIDDWTYGTYPLWWFCGYRSDNFFSLTSRCEYGDKSINSSANCTANPRKSDRTSDFR